MATFVLDNAYVTVNSVNLSDQVRAVTLEVSSDELDDSAMGDTFRSRIGGVKDWSITLEFNQDFAASEVDATIWPLVGTTTTVLVAAEGSSITATNPSYSGSVLVSQYSPFSNSYGDLATVSVTWPGAGTLTRATS